MKSKLSKKTMLAAIPSLETESATLLKLLEPLIESEKEFDRSAAAQIFELWMDLLEGSRNILLCNLGAHILDGRRPEELPNWQHWKERAPQRVGQ